LLDVPQPASFCFIETECERACGTLRICVDFLPIKEPELAVNSTEPVGNVDSMHGTETESSGIEPVSGKFEPVSGIAIWKSKFGEQKLARKMGLRNLK
jgi:hypothetical protein